MSICQLKDVFKNVPQTPRATLEEESQRCFKHESIFGITIQSFRVNILNGKVLRQIGFDIFTCNFGQTTSQSQVLKNFDWTSSFENSDMYHEGKWLGKPVSYKQLLLGIIPGNLLFLRSFGLFLSSHLDKLEKKKKAIVTEFKLYVRIYPK